MKNIPIPTVNAYKKQLISKVESVIKRMRWKAFFFLKDKDSDKEKDDEEINVSKFGFKTRKCPPQVSEMIDFENDILRIIETIKFKKTSNSFLQKLGTDARSIHKSEALYVPADKTRNYYKMNKLNYEKILRENITKNYRKAKEHTIDEINSEAKNISSNLGIDDRMDILAMKQAYITLKDHKENFENNPTCRLINPTKSEIGRVSKEILDTINATIKKSINVNQWQNSAAVIEWFKDIRNKQECTFINFDIVNFYPTISEDLLMKAINYAKQYTNISENSVSIIMHSRKSLLCDKNVPWEKRNNKNLFDVTMGSYDGAEVCELVGLLILSELSKIKEVHKIGLYRDDGLSVIRNLSGGKVERIKKKICEVFRHLGLKITIEANLKIVNFLDITLNLQNGKYSPYKKPNDHPIYVHYQSNHPPAIIKHIPASVSKRLSSLSSDQGIFKKAAPYYEAALKESGYTEKLAYMSDKETTKKTRKRKRKIIWFNPPFSKNVQSNIGRQFLNLLAKHFPPESKLHKIFNKGTVKVSYSCMKNMTSVVKSHNNKIINMNNNQDATAKLCNCRNKDACPLNGNCLVNSVVYKATVTSSKEDPKAYIGLTENAFKTRYGNHKQSFNNRCKANSTELSKYIWHLKETNSEYDIKWSILSSASAYTNATKKCDLCLTEKLLITNETKQNLLNKRSELISKCRHENKYYLANYKNVIHLITQRMPTERQRASEVTRLKQQSASSSNCAQCTSV